jgi:hypothetical protein
MKKTLSLLAAGLAASLFPGCMTPFAFTDPVTAREEHARMQESRFPRELPPGAQGEPAAAAGAPFGQDALQTPLRGWDGGVVEEPRAGEIATVDGVRHHGLEPSMEGRMHIIELYQEVLDERDQLLTEVRALQDALEKSQATLEEGRLTATGFGTRITALEEGNRRLTEENRDLAARLTTAQVRRLEAEKLLLETRIAWHRERQGLASPTAASSSLGGE